MNGQIKWISIKHQVGEIINGGQILKLRLNPPRLHGNCTLSGHCIPIRNSKLPLIQWKNNGTKFTKRKHEVRTCIEANNLLGFYQKNGLC